MKKGFTLIELLIVVCIIAILAAIAVPNFLDAQARSKVSASKANMRAASLALEAYTTDYGTGPLDPVSYGLLITNGSYWPSPVPSYFWKYALTTPVKYITKFPETPFNKLFWELWTTQSSGTKQAFISDYSQSGKNCIFWYTNWGLAAKGRKKFNAGATYSNDFYVHNDGVGYKWWMVDCGPALTTYNENALLFPNSVANQNKHLGSVNFASYDPTNGTKSQGFIVLTNKGFYTIDTKNNYTTTFCY